VPEGRRTSGGEAVVSERPILAERNTPDGVRVVLFEDTWLLHILDPHDGHDELQSHLKAVMDALGSPDHREPRRLAPSRAVFQA
jgi:hypothetical protein